jgi:hypothetical protein
MAVHVTAAADVHDTVPDAMTLHVRVVAALIVKPVLQLYVAFVWSPRVGVYANEADIGEYVT